MLKKKSPASKGRKIEHVIVLMLENRSFDHILGYRHGVNGLKGNEVNLLDPSKPESKSNPAFTVNTGAPYEVSVGEGPGHSLKDANSQLSNDGAGPSAKNPAKNNGFVRNYSNELQFADKVKHPTNAEIEVVMQGFAPIRLPSINALADHFVICDQWYSEVPGPTQPNRLYMHGATSQGLDYNSWSQIFNNRTIYNNLQDAGFTWATYEQDQNEVREYSQVNKQSHNFKLYWESFAIDVKKNALTNYSFILPRFMNTKTDMANSQHAPEDARYGDNFIADVYEALVANKDVWNKSVLIVTYDEHGGFYDHVIPPSGVPNPDGINAPPKGAAKWALPFDFTRLGLRVPAVIASPWVDPGVASARYQHTSVLATLKEWFGLPKFLTKRDASAAPFHSLFTRTTPRTDTPSKLPRATLPKVEEHTSDPAHPGNHPLDKTQHTFVMSAYHITKDSHLKGPAPDEVPSTQHDASQFIQERYVKHFGKHGKPGVVPREK